MYRHSPKLRATILHRRPNYHDKFTAMYLRYLRDTKTHMIRTDELTSTVNIRRIRYNFINQFYVFHNTKMREIHYTTSTYMVDELFKNIYLRGLTHDTCTSNAFTQSE
jgi:hypothetical protein